MSSPRLLSLLLFLFASYSLHAQLKLYESTFNGGVVTGGYSNGATVPSGSGSFNVNIPPGSTIRRAYLIAGRCGAAPNVTVTLNGTPFTFSGANAATSGFTTIYGGASGVHAIDITASINPATSAYTIAVPAQNTVSDKYPEFYLYIAFNNPGMPVISSAVFLNNTNLDVNSYTWTLATTAAVTNGSPVGLAVLGGYATTPPDCEQVIVNGTNVGSFGGQDFNASSVWGSMAGFQYYNNVLTGYNDDNANQAINGTDALSNIQALIPGSTNSFPVTFTHCGGGADNHVWGLFLTWAGVILDGRMIDLQAFPQQGSVRVDWETSDEQGLVAFDVERSANGQDFVTLGKVQAAGGESGHQYTWIDGAPIAGNAWYRLRAFTADGLTELTEVREVAMPDANQLVAGLSPNPLPKGQALQYLGAPATDLQYVIYSLADGKELQSGVLSATAAREVPTQALVPGAYGLRLTDGKHIQTLKFVVQ